MNKEVIDYMLSNSGKLPEGMTWFKLGVKLGVPSPNSSKASLNGKYKKSSIAKRTQDIWRKYLAQKGNLHLVKETYKDGKLKYETFANRPNNVDVDHSKFEVDSLTTNPYGGAWLKLKKKQKLYDEEHLEKVRGIITKNVTPTTYKPPKEVSPKGLFIYTSDKHIGALTKENSVYTNKYDKEEMRKRIVLEPLETIMDTVLLHGHLDSIFIMDLGDAIDGFNQKTTSGLRGTSSHTLPQQLNNREQHDLYLELHKELFDSIAAASYAKNVYFVGTSNSNHGGDFEYACMRTLEIYLNTKYPFIKTLVNHIPLNHFVYGNHVVVFGHGKDDEDLKHGLPLNLNDKVENYISEYIRINKIQNKFVHVVTGDLHQSAENYGKNFRYKKVLSQYGSSKWIHTNYGSTLAGLSVEVIHKYQNKIDKRDIFFESSSGSNTGIDFK